MSGGPTFTGGENCIQSTKRDYINIEFHRKDWCTYEGLCQKDDVPAASIDLCVFCKYRKPIDIPMAIRIARSKKHGS